MSSRSDVSVSSDPSTCRTRSRRNALILSVMICDRSRKPLPAVGSTTGRRRCDAVTSDDIGQTRTEVVEAPNSSAWTMTPGCGLPMSPWATTSTTSPRFKTSLPDRGPYPANHRSRRSPDASTTLRSRDEFQSGCADRAGPAPNAARDAVLARASARGAKPCAAVEFGVLPFSGRGHGGNVTCYDLKFNDSRPGVRVGLALGSWPSG
jgi:hypothetical protein